METEFEKEMQPILEYIEEKLKHRVPHVDELDKGMTAALMRSYHEEQLAGMTFEPKSKLEEGDTFLWRSGMTGRFEIHKFHSDAGYGVKTWTGYKEEDGSSTILNWSGVCGVLCKG